MASRESRCTTNLSDWTNPSAHKRYDSETEADYAQRHLQQISLLLIGAASAKIKESTALHQCQRLSLCFALRKPLSQFGFDVQLAPEELEQGDYDLNDKRFDVTIARSENRTDVPFGFECKASSFKDSQQSRWTLL